MVDIVARIKAKGKTFEIIVDCDKALALRKQGKVESRMLRDVLAIDCIFTDYKKGFKANTNDLKDAFGSDNVYEIAAKILNDGELLLPQEYREKAREQKMKQVVDFLSRNCVDPRTNAPYTAERIMAALKEVGARIDENKGVDDNALAALKDLEKVLPIKIAVKKIRIVVPPAYVGHVYGLLKNFAKEKEEWLNDGSLSCVINLPAGMQLEFYDKLNNATRGSAITEEIKEK